MSLSHEGGCLCNAIRYRVSAPPQRVTVCHCTFCQRITGSGYLVEPGFLRDDVTFEGRATATYDHVSDGSGARVTLNFCPVCAAKLYLELERFPEAYGLFGGTFDDPGWLPRGGDACRHIFVESAQPGTVLPPGVALYPGHASPVGGGPTQPLVLAHALVVGPAGDLKGMA